MIFVIAQQSSKRFRDLTRQMLEKAANLANTKSSEVVAVLIGKYSMEFAEELSSHA